MSDKGHFRHSSLSSSWGLNDDTQDWASSKQSQFTPSGYFQSGDGRLPGPPSKNPKPAIKPPARDRRIENFQNLIDSCNGPKAIEFCIFNPHQAATLFNQDLGRLRHFMNLFDEVSKSDLNVFSKMLGFFSFYFSFSNFSQPEPSVFGPFAERALGFIDQHDLYKMLLYTTFGPERVMNGLRQQNRLEKFYTLVGRNRHMSPTFRSRLSLLFVYMTLPEKQRLFQVQFNLAGNTQTADLAGLSNAYHTLNLLPPGHLAAVTQLVQEKQKPGVGGHFTTGSRWDQYVGNKRVSMANFNDSHVLRHEIGHGIEELLRSRGKGALVEQLFQRAGWKTYDSSDEMITAVGGYGNLPADLQPLAHAALKHLFTLNDSWQENFSLRGFVTKLYIANSGPTQSLKNRVEATLERFMLAADTPLVKLLLTSEGTDNYNKFKSYPSVGGNRFLYNKYRGKGVSLSEETWGQLCQWKNDSAAYSSSWAGEWFANIYSDRYAYGEGGAHTIFPDYVENFFAEHVDKFPGSGQNLA